MSNGHRGGLLRSAASVLVQGALRFRIPQKTRKVTCFVSWSGSNGERQLLPLLPQSTWSAFKRTADTLDASYAC